MQVTSSKIIKPRAYIRSSSFKMAVLFTVLLTGCGVMLGWLLYDFSQNNLIRETEAAIDYEIQNIMLATAEMDEQARRDLINMRAQRSNPLYFYQNPQGEAIAGNLSALPSEIERMAEGVIGFSHQREQMAAKIHTFHDGSRLLVARSIEGIVASHEKLATLSLLMMGFMLAVVVISFFLSYFVVSRINRIGEVARQIIETGDLSRRIEVDSSWDDLSNLAQVLNVLLARIDALMEGIREVSDNIAHDLRTPLTRLRTRMEAAKTSGATAQEMAAFLEEVDQILATFRSLLRIAKLEKGSGHEAFAPVALHEVVSDVLELYEPLAEARDVTLNASITQSPALEGDRDLLFQMVANLLDNAIKFSPANGTVTVDLSATHLSITDEGAGLSETQKQRVFDRFYRVQQCRSIPGNGLGLSLVKAVSELHGFTLNLDDNHPTGLVVKVITTSEH